MTPQVAAQAGLQVVRTIADVWSHAKPESLIDFTRQLRVEPIALIDADCLYLESLPDVMQSLLSLFSGYYLQAVALSCNIGNVETRRHLDALNPNRDATRHALDMGRALAVESYEHELPFTPRSEMGLEAVSDHIPEGVKKRLADRAEEWKRSRDHSRSGAAADLNAGPGTNAYKQVQEASNLSVGKLLEVTIGDGKHSGTLPVAVRLMANQLPSASLVHILSVGAQDTSVKERWHAWRAGQLEFVRDLLLCRDLIDEHRRRLMKDKDGIYSAMTSRKTNSAISGILTGQPSIGMASNIVVMSDTTASEVEMKTNYKLANYSQRQKIFEETALMIMAVIDKRWERVTFYHRGISLPTEVSVRELKAANKGNGPDVSDILKAYQLGNAPSI